MKNDFHIGQYCYLINAGYYQGKRILKDHKLRIIEFSASNDAALLFVVDLNMIIDVDLKELEVK